MKALFTKIFENLGPTLENPSRITRESGTCSREAFQVTNIGEFDEISLFVSKIEKLQLKVSYFCAKKKQKKDIA